MTSLSGLPNSIPGAGATNVVSRDGGSFGDNPFLAILVQQLQSQTPTEPVDNASLTQQMSSLANVQQQQELNENMLALLDYQGLLARLQGLSESSSLLGKNVTWLDSRGLEVSGTVDSVAVNESGQVRVRAGEQEFDLRDVVSIRSANDGSTTTTPDSV